MRKRFCAASAKINFYYQLLNRINGGENRYRPYGERSDVQISISMPRESKGRIGERDDPETGLTYLNARYYDPVLARFIQPDWWDPTDPKVGTNRYAYGLNNPILHKDPSGHIVAHAIAAGIGAVEGLAAQGFEDAVSGKFSGGLAYGKAAGLGALAGVTGGAAGSLAAKGLTAALGAAKSSIGGKVQSGISGAVAGAVGAGVSSVGAQTIENGLAEVDLGQVAKDMAQGVLGGFVLGGTDIGARLGGIAAKAIPGVLGKVAGKVTSAASETIVESIVGGAVDKVGELSVDNEQENENDSDQSSQQDGE